MGNQLTQDEVIRSIVRFSGNRGLRITGQTIFAMVATQHVKLQFWHCKASSRLKPGAEIPFTTPLLIDSLNHPVQKHAELREQGPFWGHTFKLEMLTVSSEVDETVLPAVAQVEKHPREIGPSPFAAVMVFLPSCRNAQPLRHLARIQGQWRHLSWPKPPAYQLRPTIQEWLLTP